MNCPQYYEQYAWRLLSPRYRNGRTHGWDLVKRALKTRGMTMEMFKHYADSQLKNEARS